MMVTRYEFAARRATGRDLLEVACGAGQGLGLLATRASSVAGGDFTERLVRVAKAHYGSRVPVLRLDAHALPYADGSIDVVLLYEAIYYLRNPERFFAECRRILRPGGEVIVCSANPELDDFHPSPHSVRYHSARELAELLRSAGFRAQTLGAFAVTRRGWKSRVRRNLKRFATALHLVPRTMRGKELLKRIFYGRLVAMPRELEPTSAGNYEPPVEIDATEGPVLSHRVIYAIGQPE